MDGCVYILHSMYSYILQLTLSLQWNVYSILGSKAWLFVVCWVLINYRPQRSWAKVMFLQASVILSMGGCLPQCMLGCQTPPDQAPTQEHTHPGADTPQSRHHTSQSRHHTPQSRPPPPRADPPGSRHPPGPGTPSLEADASIRSMSGQYASYWNAFLFLY